MTYRVLLASLTLLIFSIPSQDSSYAQEDKPVLNIQNVPDRRIVDVRGKAELAVFEEFIRKNPDLEIKKAVPLALEGSLGESSDYMAFAGGTAPDVLQLHLRKVPNFLDQNFLLPLDDYLTEEWKEAKGVPEQLWGVVERNDKTYGVINDYYVMGLIFRKDMLRREGLEPRAPKDWDEFYYYCQRLTHPSRQVERVRVQRGQYGLLLANGQLAGWIWTSFVWLAGGDMVHHFKVCPECNAVTQRKKEIPLETCDECGEDISSKKIPEQWKAVYDSEAGITALNFYKKLRWSKWTRCSCGEPIDIRSFDYKTGEWTEYESRDCEKCGTHLDFSTLEPEQIHEGVVRLTSANLTEPMFYGEVAMTVAIPSQTLYEDAKRFAIRAADIGFTSLPPGPGGQKANFIGGSVFGINSTSNPEIHDEAWDYLAFFAGREAEEIRTRVYVENGYANLVNPRDLKRFGYEEYLEDLPPELIEGYEELEQHGRVEPTSPQYQNVQTTYLARPIDNVLLKRETDVEAELRRSAEEVNRTVFQLEEEQVSGASKFWGTVVIAILLVLIVYVGWREVKGLASSYKTNKELHSRNTMRQHLFAWLFMLPALLSVFVWQYIPLFRGSLMAFYDYKLLEGLEGSRFVFADNFFEAFTDMNFWIYVLQTLYYVGLTIGIGFIAPIFLALLLAEVPRGKMLFRVLFYLPAVTTGIVIMFLWKRLLYDPSPEGVLNSLVVPLYNWFGELRLSAIEWWTGLFGGPEDMGWVTEKLTGAFMWTIDWLPNEYVSSFDWLNNPSLAMLCIVLPGVWAGAGPGSIIYLAALKCVPNELYEAAEIDGANIRHKVFHIVVPVLKPLIIINFVGAFIGAFRAMENIFVMTGGGPGTTTRTVGIEIWVQAFLNLRFGYATALAWILGAGLIGFTIYQLRILKNVEFRAADTAAQEANPGGGA